MDEKIYLPSSDVDVSRKDFIEIAMPERKRRVVITITRRQFYDPDKKKVITDQVLHKAVYGKK